MPSVLIGSPLQPAVQQLYSTKRVSATAMAKNTSHTSGCSSARCQAHWPHARHTVSSSEAVGGHSAGTDSVPMPRPAQQQTHTDHERTTLLVHIFECQNTFGIVWNSTLHSRLTSYNEAAHRHRCQEAWGLQQCPLAASPEKCSAASASQYRHRNPPGTASRRLHHPDAPAAVAALLCVGRGFTCTSCSAHSP